MEISNICGDLVNEDNPIYLVGGTVVYLPLWKMMEWKSVGMMKFPTEWKFIKNMFQTTNQKISDYNL